MEAREISLDLINEPKFDVRTLIIQEELDDLSDSINAVGVLNPLRVFSVGGRYEIEDGHRRYLAAHQVGLLTVPCIVIESEEDKREFKKLHANIHSKGLTAVEKSRVLHHMADKYGYSREDLAKIMGVNTSRIAQLLGIQNWHEDIREQVEAGVMSEHIGYELNKVKDPKMRKYYSDYARHGGATLNVVKSWVAKEQINESMPQAPEPPRMDVPPPDQPIEIKQRCACCSNDFDPQTLMIMRLCGECYTDLRRIMPEIRQAIKQEKEGRTGAKDSD